MGGSRTANQQQEQESGSGEGDSLPGSVRMTSQLSYRSRSSAGYRSIYWLLATVFLCGSFTTVSGIKCWECNSEYDKRCGDPFESLTTELVDCDQKTPEMKHLMNENGTIPQATICRKTVQSVNEVTRIIRSCGWLENPPSMKDRDCFTRTGTNQVMVYHCACHKEGCNSGNHVAYSLLVLAIISLASFIL